MLVGNGVILLLACVYGRVEYEVLLCTPLQSTQRRVWVGLSFALQSLVEFSVLVCARIYFL